MDIKPFLVVVFLLILILLFWLRWRKDYYDAIEEPNPEYLEEINKSRHLILTEIMEHLRVIFTLSNEDLKAATVELVSRGINRISIAAQDQLFTILVRWGKNFTLICYRNKNVEAETIVYRKRTFSLKNNCINWKKVDLFLAKTLDKFMEVNETEEDFKDIVISATEVANTVNDEELLKLLFTAIDHYPWAKGHKLPPRIALKDYVVFLAYLLKHYQKEFVAHLSENIDPEE